MSQKQLTMTTPNASDLCSSRSDKVNALIPIHLQSVVYESFFIVFAAVSIEMCFDRFWNSITLMENSSDTVELTSKYKFMRLSPELAIPGQLLIKQTTIEIVQSKSNDMLTETSFHWANKITFIYSRKKSTRQHICRFFSTFRSKTSCCLLIWHNNKNTVTNFFPKAHCQMLRVAW